MRPVYERLGLDAVVIGLALGVAGGIVLFPVWSGGSGGYGMHVLLGDIPYEPYGFVLNLLLPASAVVGIVGAGLIEVGRPRVVSGGGFRLDRERIALLVAAVTEALFLASFGFVNTLGVDVLSVYAVNGVILTVAVGLYLLWTAKRMHKSSSPVSLAALVLSGVCVGLAVVVDAMMSPPALASWDVLSVLDVSRWLFGEASLALWLAAFVGIAWHNRSAARPGPVAS